MKTIITVQKIMKVQITIRQSWYARCDTVIRHLNKEGTIWEGTRQEAVKEIKSLQSYRHELSHNEYGFPSYRVTYYHRLLTTKRG